MDRSIEKVRFDVPAQPKAKRVAAYARVSSGKYTMLHSLSVSENQKWRIQKNFKVGKPWNGAMLGYRNVNGTLTVIPEEAEIVK